MDALKKTWWFAWMSVIFLGLGHLKDVTDGIDHFLITTKRKKPEAIVLAENAERSEIGRNLAETAWRRLFWARAFRARVDHHAPQSEIDEAWKSYIAASEAWSSRVMIYIIYADRFYGSDRADELEKTVQNSWIKMESSLISLRYSDVQDNKDIKDACKSAIDEVNAALYHFVRAINQGDRTK